MIKERRHLLRMAVRLQQQYALQRRQALLESIADNVDHIRSSIDLAANHERMLRRAVNCGWNLCLAEKWADYTWAVQDIENQARAIHSKTTALGFRPLHIPGSTIISHECWTPPSLRELHDELLQAQREFGEVAYDKSERRLSVTTDRIELEGIDLGPFRIDLFLGQMRSASTEHWFLLSAVAPNSASGREEIIHPHITDGKLCTGDGAAPIQQALLNGRIGEFFMLVRSVLETYNADSAYVMLEHWSGQSCHDCGYFDEPDQLYFCEGCEHDFCEECMRSCEICRTTLCRGCLSTSDISDDYVCSECGAYCSDCGQFGTSDEITDGLCETCRTAAEEEQDAENEVEPTTTTNTQEHSHDESTLQSVPISGC